MKWELASRWWQAGIATTSNVPSLLDRLCVSRDDKVGIYGFLFDRDGEWAPAIVDDNMYMTSADWDELSYEDLQKVVLNLGAYRDKQTSVEEAYRAHYQTGSNSLYFSSCKDQNDTWLPLFEKAYAKAHGDYSALNWGNPGYGNLSSDVISVLIPIATPREALEDLTGGVSTQVHVKDIINRDRFWDEQVENANDVYLFTVQAKPYVDFQTSWEGTTSAPDGTPIIRTYEGFGLKLLLLRYDFPSPRS